MPIPTPSPKDLGLNSSSFVEITDTDTGIKRAIINVEGMQKQGKTDFCLRTFPDPIVVFNLDQGLEWVVEKFVKKGKRIIVAGAHRPKGAKYPSYHFARPVPEKSEIRKGDAYLTRVKKLAGPIWEKFIEDYKDFLESKARTGVIDTGGAALQLAKFAFHGMDKVTSKDDPYGQKGGEMKAIFQGLITDAYNYDKNVIWTHRLKEEWVGGQPAGTFKLDGYAQLPFEVQLTIRLKTKGRKETTRRIAEIRDCRIGKGNYWNGAVFGDEDGPPLDFATIMSTLTKTAAEEWE